MTLTAEQLAKAREAKSIEELTALAKAEGMEVSAEEIEKLWNTLHAEGELADDELDKVAGGGTIAVMVEDNSLRGGNPPSCYMCGIPLSIMPDGSDEVLFEGAWYDCDEYKCKFYRCYNTEHYIHIWEGDRWLRVKYMRN